MKYIYYFLHLYNTTNKIMFTYYSIIIREKLYGQLEKQSLFTVR